MATSVDGGVRKPRDSTALVTSLDGGTQPIDEGIDGTIVLQCRLQLPNVVGEVMAAEQGVVTLVRYFPGKRQRSEIVSREAVMIDTMGRKIRSRSETP